MQRRTGFFGSSGIYAAPLILHGIPVGQRWWFGAAFWSAIVKSCVVLAVSCTSTLSDVFFHVGTNTPNCAVIIISACFPAYQNNKQDMSKIWKEFLNQNECRHLLFSSLFFRAMSFHEKCIIMLCFLKMHYTVNVSVSLFLSGSALSLYFSLSVSPLSLSCRKHYKPTTPTFIHKRIGSIKLIQDQERNCVSTNFDQNMTIIRTINVRGLSCKIVDYVFLKKAINKAGKKLKFSECLLVKLRQNFIFC